MVDFSKYTKATRTKVDFSDAGDRGPFNPRHQEEGDYLFKIVACLDTPTKEGGKPQWSFALQDVENKSNVYPYRCLLDKAQAWKLRNIFEAAGKRVPQKMMNVDPQSIIGKLIGASLIDREYKGKIGSEVDQVFSAKEFDTAKDEDTDDDIENEEEVEEDDEEEEAPPPPKKSKKAAPAKAPTKKAKKKPEPEPDDDDDEEVEDGDDEEMEVEDL